MFTFACMEKPQRRCFISSWCYDTRLSSRPDGSIFSIVNRQAWEKWIILPDSHNHDFVLIQNNFHGHYLTSDEEGGVSTTMDKKNEDAQWYIYLSSSKDKYFIYSVLHKKWLQCNHKKDIYTANHNDNESWSKWILEFDTGELCFITTNPNDIQKNKSVAIHVEIFLFLILRRHGRSFVSLKLVKGM